MLKLLVEDKVYITLMILFFICAIFIAYFINGQTFKRFLFLLNLLDVFILGIISFCFCIGITEELSVYIILTRLAVMFLAGLIPIKDTSEYKEVTAFDKRNIILAWINMVLFFFNLVRVISVVF